MRGVPDAATGGVSGARVLDPSGMGSGDPGFAGLGFAGLGFAADHAPRRCGFGRHPFRGDPRKV
jgi:hypothetical protein